ncbi:MAG TPA: hypothetical protein PL001_11285 [Candidatus Kryptobacter bacterium]|nr:hypothetical protein [Candidatus Kryptobacter bacterium]
MRIPVMQDGARFESPENILTVVANESYEDFAKNLQEDYRQDGIAAPPMPANRREKISAKLRQDLFKGEFSGIWQKLRVKTEFQTIIDSDGLVASCCVAIREHVKVRKPIMDVRKARVEFNKDGFDMRESESEPVRQLEITYSVPDMVSRISNESGLTKKTVARILLECGKLEEAFNNPEEFVSRVSTIVKEQKIRMDIKTSKYSKTDGKYPDEIFEKEVSTYRTAVLDSENSVYDKVICDNGSERQFADDLTKDNAQVKVFCKLPQNYYIGTPTGNYRPDWAIIYQQIRIGGKTEHKLYLVRETKFGYSPMSGTRKSIPQDEQDKIDCALKHFEAVGELDYRMVDSYEDFKRTLPN